MKYFYVPALASLFYIDGPALMAIPHLYNGVIDTDSAVRVDENIAGDEVIHRDGQALNLSKIYTEVRRVLSEPVAADSTV